MASKLKRLRYARRYGAPRVIIKAEQIRLACARAGQRYSHLNPSPLQLTLEERHALYA